eukprot:scaffold270_cov121-Isochrysis_galbana.AAC.2
MRPISHPVTTYCPTECECRRTLRRRGPPPPRRPPPRVAAAPRPAASCRPASRPGSGIAPPRPARVRGRPRIADETTRHSNRRSSSRRWLRRRPPLEPTLRSRRRTRGIVLRPTPSSLNAPAPGSSRRRPAGCRGGSRSATQPTAPRGRTPKPAERPTAYRWHAAPQCRRRCRRRVGQRTCGGRHGQVTRPLRAVYPRATKGKPRARR